MIMMMYIKVNSIFPLPKHNSDHNHHNYSVSLHQQTAIINKLFIVKLNS